MAQLGQQAAFLAALRVPPSSGRQHVGERGRHRSAGGTAALRHATIVLPDAAERDRSLGRLDAEPQETEGGPVVTDPSGNALLFAVAAP